MNYAWPHAPMHITSERGTYMVTAATYRKALLFNSPEKTTILHDTILQLANERGWKMQAWAVMQNHYHFIAMSPDNPETLQKFVSDVHRKSAMAVNAMDNAEGRKVWYQYWDSLITFEESYYARLKYVHYNPVHHGLVKNATEYDWCSAKWFEGKSDPAYRKTVLGFKIGRINVKDDF
jgi:putative transposase